MTHQRFEVWQIDGSNAPVVRVGTFGSRREAEAFVGTAGGRLIVRDTGATVVHAPTPTPSSDRGRPRVIERDETTRHDPRRPSRAPRAGTSTPSPTPVRRDSGVLPRVTPPAPESNPPRAAPSSPGRSRASGVPAAPISSPVRSSRAPRARSTPSITPAPVSRPRVTPAPGPPPSGPHRAPLPSEPVIAAVDPEELEQRARIRHLMARGRFTDASEVMTRAGLEGDELALYRAWIDTEKLLADDNDVGLDPELGKLAAAALRENRQLGFGYYVLGRIAEVEDRGDDAARAFRIATQLSPEHRDARRRDHLCRRRGNGH